MAAFTFIASDAALRGAALEWHKCPELAIDLEMEANLHHYGMHLALVQLADEQQVWLVDMLSINDHSPLAKLLRDERILKVFHDVSFDFRILDEKLSCRPKNIFDTRVAALLAGRTAISLSGLLQEEFGVSKDERFQKIDWLKRPLTSQMLAYAAGDVRYLLKLKALLERQLRTLGRLDWLHEECALLERQPFTAVERSYAGVKGSRTLSDAQRGVLKGIYEVREELAKSLDRPVFFVIPDRLLLELAKNPPAGTEGWQSLRGVHPAVRRFAGRFASAVAKARSIPKEKIHAHRLTNAQRQAIDELLLRRQAVAQRLKVEPFVVLSKEQAEGVVLGRAEVLRAWQRRTLSLQ